LRLVAFTLEEAPAYMTGHQGSRAYVKSLKERGEEVLGAAVLEMVGYTAPKQLYPTVLKWAGYPKEGNFIGIVGNRRSRRFARALLAGFRDNPGLPVESLNVPFDGRVLPATRLSDHASFWDHGFPAVMITDTAFFRNPYYHTPGDTMETLDFGFMAALVRSLELALGRLEA
jgi:Zn-dependent M28 family amino/carboxypeptidase